MGEVPPKPGRGVGNARVGSPTDDISTRGRDPSEELSASAVGSHPIPVADRYLLGTELGRGGMGRVVEAFDLQLGRTVAFKEVLPTGGPALARRFAREVQLTAKLEHPSIVPLYDSGTTADGRPFYVMRRVSGRPLDQLMARAVGLGERLTLLPALLAAIDAVAHAHRRGVIHRDLKPSNIVVGDLGETMVIDWGLAKVIGEDNAQPGTVIVAGDSLRTQAGTVFGTPGFMAPEQARGEPLDERSDVYALGATLYQLLSGAPPHAGTTATEVIAVTATREVAPVASVAPGAPPELVAIVGKALAFKPEGRYADASALGEDVRRFLDGRLVDAHQYTPRQRLARFARRHRAALSVAALAVTAVTALAWVGVGRIVDERDAANRARLAASEDKAAAERARDELQRRADQLVVMQARGLLDKNPTHAAAVLKELPSSSPRLGDARAVAQAAIVRGAAWTMPTSDELTVVADLSADGSLLVQTTRAGMVRIWDLAHRKLVVERRYPHDTRALWAGTLVLAFPPDAAPELFDPLTSATKAIGLPPIASAVAAANGSRVAFIDERGHAGVLEIATGNTTPLWPGHDATQLALTADGRWVALADRTTVIVVDAAGREIASRPGVAVQLIASRFDEIAYTTSKGLVLCKLEPRPVWTELDTAPLLPAIAIASAFVGHEIDIYMSSGKVMAWRDGRLGERITLGGLSSGLAEADRELLVAAGIDGKLHFANRLITGELHLPIPLTNLKLLARPGSPRIIALGRGLIVGFDLSDSFPEELRFPAGTSATLADDETLLLWSAGHGAQWYDLRTRTVTPFPYEPRGIPTVIDVDPTDGRILITDQADDTSLVVVHKGSAQPQSIVRARSAWARLLPRGALLYTTGDSRLFAVIDAAPAREVAALDSVVDNAVGLGGTRFAAISTAGEVVRGDFATHELERIRVAAAVPGRPTPGSFGMVGADHAGRVLIGHDHRLLLWDRDVVELAVLDQRILQIAPSDDGVMLELTDHSLVWTALTPGQPVRSLLSASNHPPLFSYDGHLALGRTVNGQVIVVEATTQSVWDLPAYYAAFDIMTIAPTARRFVQGGFGQLALWTLPQAPAELRAWLDERTNAATDDDHALVWPRPRVRP
jgi:hypothetical protein